MFSSVQVALLFDLNSFSKTVTSEKELEEYVARLKLSSLRLLTEFGAQTEKGSEVVQWSYKYYDSRSFKPDTARKSFQDFNRKSFDDFENDLTDRFYRAFDAIQGDGSAGGKSGAVQNQNIIQSTSGLDNKPHCYILNKSFQEVVHDYNWDRPDISSPVKSNRRRTQNKSKLIPENVGPYNAVIVYTNVPKSQNELRKFCGEEGDVEGTADNFMDAVLDPTTRRYFQEEKQIRPYFINLTNLGEADDKNLYNGIRSGLSKLQGGLFGINTLVQTTPMCLFRNGGNNKTKSETILDIFPIPSQPVVGAAHSLHSEWWLKGRPGRARKPQPGPALIWEDSQGASFLKAQLEVLAVQGSSSRAWGAAVVVGVVQLNAVSLVAVAGGMGSLYVCQAPNTAFTTLIQLLAKYQLAMLLRLGCGGLALLCPWAGDIGCLAVVSSSGLAVPPLSSTSQQSDEILAHFATEIVKRCLGAAPAHTKSEPTPSDKRFDPQKTERWFYPERATVDTINKIKKKRTERVERKIMLERLQKKYRPQIPQPLSSGEIGSLSVMAPVMASAGDMSNTTANAAIAQNKKLPIGKKLSISRAQQLMQNSRVVTAQQKFKDLRSEEEERAKASKRRTAQANEQQRKTEALASQTLNAVQDPQDTSQFVSSLIALRDGTDSEADVPDIDLFTTAQTIMNLTLMHVKVVPGTNMESGLRKVLDDGVLQNMQQINEIHSGPSKLRQYKIQALLNLELLWILGYSSSSKTDDENSEAANHSAEVREELVEAAIKMLRAIMLHYNPNAMATFLQETITENYCETLGEVLVEIYEELNQPLPENLAILTGNLMSVAPQSIKSNTGSVQSYDSGAVGSFEINPGSGKEIKRSTTALQRHPSFKETTKRQIVVPIGPRVGLRRTVSDAQTKPKPATKQLDKPQVTKKNKADVDVKKSKAEDDVRKVRRSLFDMDDAPKAKLQRSHTISGASDLRRSPRKKSRKSTATPKKNKTSSSSQESFKTPLKDTPTSETGWKTPKSKIGSSERILVPETPHYKIGTNEFNKGRVRKSTGNTIITESPDVKRACKTTPRRLRASLTISRRNSFYSGARSRNWEKGKSQLLVDKIRGKYDRKSLDISAIENVGDASFLFSEILSASQSDISQDLENIALPEKKVLNFGLDDENVENEHSVNTSRLMDFSGFSSPLKNTRFASKGSAESEEASTPLKNIRRSLPMTSPAKTQLSMASPAKPHSFLMPSPSKPRSHIVQSPLKGMRKQSLPSFDSPSKNTNMSTSMGSDVFESPSKNTRSSLSSPVKDLIFSPAKIKNVNVLMSNEELMKISPMKSRQNSLLQNACMLSMTPSKRVQFNFVETPSKRGSTGTNSPTPKSILKTPGKTPTKSPLRTPKKSPKMTPNKLIRNRVSQSPFKASTKSPLRTILMTTPTKVEFKTPTKSPHSKTPVKSPFRSPNLFFSSTRILRTPNKTPSKEESSANLLQLSNIQADEFSDLVPETPNRININVTTLDKLPLIDREMELSSPVKGSLSHSTASIVLHNTPTKGQQGIQRDLFNLDPVEIPIATRSTIYPPPAMCKANKQDDGDGSTNLPDIAPEDIEFVNSIMFGSNFDPDSGLGITGSSDEDDEIYKQRLNGMLNSLSSPVKGSGHNTQEVVMGFDQEVSLGLTGNCTTPVKLDSLLNDYIEEIKTPGKDFKLNVPETMESPEISLDPKIRKYFEKMKRKDSLLSKEEELCYAENFVPETKESKNGEQRSKTRKSVEIEVQNNFVIPSTSYSTNNIDDKDAKFVVEQNLNKKSSRRKISLQMENEVTDIAAAKVELENSTTDEVVQNSTKRKLLTEDEGERENKFSKISNGNSIEKENAKAIKKKRISNENNASSKENVNDSKRKSKRLSNDIVFAENVQKDEEVNNKSVGKVEKYMESVNLQASMLFSSEDFEKTKLMNEEKDEIFLKKIHTKNIKVTKDEDEIFLKSSRTGNSHKKRIFDSDSDISPFKLDDTESAPLKNVENALTTINENHENGEVIKEMSTPDRRHKQQKIDVYLSPGHKPSGIDTTPTRGAIDSLHGRKRPVTPLDDWKRIKPLRGLKTNPDKSEVDFDEKLTDSTTKSKTEGKRSPKKNKKRKSGVKLKIAKTSEGYKATTNVSLEGSDLNSSTEQSQKENLNDSNSTDNIFTPKPKKKKSIDYEKMSILTPHRFTRGISKDLHVTPDVFQKLITLSPVKGADESKNARRLSDEFLGAKIEEELTRKTKSTNKYSRHKVLSADLEDLPMPTPSPDKTTSAIHDLSAFPMPKLSPDKSNYENSQNSDLDGHPMPSPSPDKPPLVKETPLKGMKDIWTATSVPGSPTMTKFIRKERKKNSICKTPRIQLSPVHYGDSVSSLSMQSILHLASSPIIKTKSDINKNSNSNKSKRLFKSRKQILSSVELDNISEHPNGDPEHSVAPIKKIYKTYEEKILEEVALIDKKFKTRRRSSTLSVDSEDSIKIIGQPKSPIIKSSRKKPRRSNLYSQEDDDSEVFQSPPKSKRSRVNSHGSTNEASDGVLRQELPVTPKAYKTYEDRIMEEVKQLSNTPRTTRPSKNLKDISSPEDDEKVHKPRKSNVFKTTKRKLERDLPETVDEDIVDDEQSRPSRNCKTPRGVCYISPVSSEEEEYYPRQKSRTGRRLSKPISILD